MDASPYSEKIKLRISDDLRNLLESRGIFDSDIRQVIEFAERTRAKLLNQRNGHFLAHHNPAATVTFWVEYSVADGEFIIHKAYSHRMEVI